MAPTSPAAEAVRATRPRPLGLANILAAVHMGPKFGPIITIATVTVLSPVAKSAVNKMRRKVTRVVPSTLGRLAELKLAGPAAARLLLRQKEQPLLGAVRQRAVGRPEKSPVRLEEASGMLVGLNRDGPAGPRPLKIKGP